MLGETTVFVCEFVCVLVGVTTEVDDLFPPTTVESDFLDPLIRGLLDPLGGGLLLPRLALLGLLSTTPAIPSAPPFDPNNLLKLNLSIDIPLR